MSAPAAPRPSTLLELPTDPSGAGLALLVQRARVAIARGDVVVDSTVTTGWSPGPRLVLHRLQQLAERAGRQWTDTGSPSA
ncbi:hypothetical protein SAMN06264364_11167 [Quadrisphaera granulorum]|uniref:Uncharacterized protein n=1 Tax=Quadrisphaera granulorum TaxID=317664 RepID=A0A316A9W9_9ACTN|nr:hypothetical protein [Quadrisphaera granulorum]PWJ53664.1 hypothetical protein BXY45_11167 [Quadrisphaera granulorum]SZE96708.1 hypothetical protein SAMN06264364_11167 [Quadrisphaera granulorum]